MKSPDEWQRLATALDFHFAGWSMSAIGDYFGVSKERARQLVELAKRQLAHRIFATSRLSWKWDDNQQRWSCGR
jgi:hypothetical protein